MDQITNHPDLCLQKKNLNDLCSLEKENVTGLCKIEKENIDKELPMNDENVEDMGLYKALSPVEEKFDKGEYNIYFCTFVL